MMLPLLSERNIISQIKRLCINVGLVRKLSRDLKLNSDNIKARIKVKERSLNWSKKIFKFNGTFQFKFRIA